LAARQGPRLPAILSGDCLLSTTTTTRRDSSSRSFSTSTSLSHASSPDRLIVIGSGVAGSAAALIAAETHQIPVTMIYAGNLPTDCNSYWAQGGIIYRNYDAASGDSAASLAADIHRAGAGLCDDDAVQKVSNEGPDRVRELLLDARGDASTGSGRFAHVPFDRVEATGELSLCLEASHAAPRILHKADHTGRTITENITEAAARHPLITQQPHTIVTDLIVQDGTCIGVQTLDRSTGQVSSQYATAGTVLASGGLCGIYQHSTNPAGFNALGSSVALAVRAGVATQDLEYVQFHPTALCIPNEARFLLSEALRGEGAILRDMAGRAFARDYHEDGELAPRDVVARAVFEESQKQGQPVVLDITHRDSDWVRSRFPSIQQHLAERGLDLATNVLPITPAAHYTCGGISTDLKGRTGLKGLYAAGEAARTGLHGGNRLASTSLLEGLVFGASVADFVASEEGRDVRNQAAQVLSSSAEHGKNNAPSTTSSLEPANIENAAHRAMQLLTDLRRTMWDEVGVVRTPSGLENALEELNEIREEAVDLHATCVTLETAAVRDAAFSGYAVAQAALANRQSVGAHCIVPDAESDSDEDELVSAAGR
jgi:L-aspartate oxidase